LAANSSSTALVSTVILALLLTLQMPMSVLAAPSAFQQEQERSLISLQKNERWWGKRFRLAGIATRTEKTANCPS